MSKQRVIQLALAMIFALLLIAVCVYRLDVGSIIRITPLIP